MPNIGLKRLEEKQAKLAGWLAGKLEEIRGLRATRDVELAEHRAALAVAEEHRAMNLACAEDMAAEAQEIREQIAELQAQLDRVIGSEAAWLADDEGIPVIEQVIAQYRVEWRERLRKAHDGQSRRKFNEHQRLTRRIEARRVELAQQAAAAADREARGVRAKHDILYPPLSESI